MNKKLLLMQRNASARLLNMQDRMHRGCIRFGENEGDRHFSAKCVICRELNRLGLEFITEARFLNKSRADIFCLDKGVAIEVLNSESLFNISKKRVKYPVAIEYLQLKTGMKVKDIVSWVKMYLERYKYDEIKRNG